jgi:hypothetical protein
VLVGQKVLPLLQDPREVPGEVVGVPAAAREGERELARGFVEPRTEGDVSTGALHAAEFDFLKISHQQ